MKIHQLGRAGLAAVAATLIMATPAHATPATQDISSPAVSEASASNTQNPTLDVSWPADYVYSESTWTLANPDLHFDFEAAPAATQVPEPASLVLALTGLVGLGLVRRRRSRDASL
jgi:hypothetical protein